MTVIRERGAEALKLQGSSQVACGQGWIQGGVQNTCSVELPMLLNCERVATLHSVSHFHLGPIILTDREHVKVYG